MSETQSHATPEHGDTGRERAKFWGQKTFLLLTGASQGIGRNFSIEFARKLAPNSVLVLLARSAEGLRETQSLVLQANPNVRVTTSSVDLGKAHAQDFQLIITNALKEFDASPKDFELALIVHNAGSLGRTGQLVADMSNADDWVQYLGLNLTSVSVLNSEFLKVFSSDTGVSRTVVNITSLCAVQPFRSMGYYCVGKAAREMFFKVLAEEDPTLDVLSYSPGPVETDMTAEIMITTAPEIKNAFKEMRGLKKMLTCDQTTQRAIEVLGNKKYKSGQRVDYFDVGY